jgi:hypothetical protein
LFLFFIIYLFSNWILLLNFNFILLFVWLLFWLLFTLYCIRFLFLDLIWFFHILNIVSLYLFMAFSLLGLFIIIVFFFLFWCIVLLHHVNKTFFLSVHNFRLFRFIRHNSRLWLFNSSLFLWFLVNCFHHFTIRV